MSAFKNSTTSAQVYNALHVNGFHSNPPHARTPTKLTNPLISTQLAGFNDEETGADEDPKLSVFRELYLRSEARLGALFGSENAGVFGNSSATADESVEEQAEVAAIKVRSKVAGPAKKAVRNIDEEDYDDSDGEDEETPATISPLKAKSTGPIAIPALSSTSMVRANSSSSAQTLSKTSGFSAVNKTSDDVRKKLEEDKKATEEAAKRSFHTLFYTVENDRDAMLDQSKLEESERQVDVEMSSHHHNNNTPINGNSTNTAALSTAQQGTLSQTNLGASSLTLKHLIARIDSKREKVRASDAELRNLMSEVRKNRSKWASEDRVGQEELYEAAEKVLSELKAMTEHSTAFLSRVNKREAPDYSNVIKQPMDLGTMTKKLKAVQYKSKQDFVTDLNLIWSNCLKYNANPEHFLRRHALFMRKETEKLVPLIPNITIRDRAEVEAEERRMHQAEAEMDGGEESDDEPIISSRGRKAPGKKAKKGSTAPRKAPTSALEGSPAAETKPSVHLLGTNGLGSNLKHETLRASSEGVTERSQTPPPRAITPVGVNGFSGPRVPTTEPDTMDVDSLETSINGVIPPFGEVQEEVDRGDPEHETWKQVTKKDRALVTVERHRLFKGNELNEDEPALLRRKAGMRSWLRVQKQAAPEGALGRNSTEAEIKRGDEVASGGETLAEGMEDEEEKFLPDYYDVMSAIPDLPSRLRWIENSPGEVTDPSDEFLRILPRGLFTSPDSPLTRKIEDNMRQLQATRKICSKIGVVKQMQIQSQMYHGQFQRVDPAPLVEQDVEAHVMNDEGPVVSPTVCRAALKRSVGKLFFHAGFEEFQPSALDAVTDLAADFFTKVASTLVKYSQAHKIPIETSVPGSEGENKIVWKDRFTTEEMILHTLHENGSDLEALDGYVKDEIDRSGTKLIQMQDRMKAHLAELLRPALNDGGPDGSNSFNDGSDQFVSGVFADEISEDFFGFKELGLDKEFSLASLGVPLHLLQNRMHSVHQSQNQSILSSNSPSALPPPVLLSPITVDNVANQIGLVQNFFLAKLQANENKPLVEDDDLPQKQRFPKPRLPPTGKISSPRKRPAKEPGPGKGHPRKKMKLNEPDRSPVGKLKLGPPAEDDATVELGKELSLQKGKEKESQGTINESAGMISPESLEAI